MKLPPPKRYRVSVQGGPYTIYLSQLKATSGFVASILHSEKLRTQNPQKETLMKFELQSFFNSTEEAVLNDCSDWLAENFGSSFSIQPAEQ